MSDTGGRAAVLGAIRSALGREPEGTGQQTCATPPVAQTFGRAPGTGQETCATPESTSATLPGGPGLKTWAPTQLLERFVRMSEDAQAAVSVVSSMEAARARLAEILRAEGARSVAVSPDAAGEPWAALPAVEADGRHALRRSPGAPARGELLAADAGVTAAAFAIADTGTLALVASPGDHRLDSLLPPVHVALVRAGTLVPDLGAAIARLAAAGATADHSAVVFVRGPSRTADIELTLTVGVHGPGRTHVIIADC